MIGAKPATVKDFLFHRCELVAFYESHIMASKAAIEAASAVYPVSPRLLRLYQIIGSQTKNIQPLIPISRSCWLAGVKSGKFPQGIKLSPKVTVWHEASVLALISSVGA